MRKVMVIKDDEIRRWEIGERVVRRDDIGEYVLVDGVKKRFDWIDIRAVTIH